MTRYVHKDVAEMRDNPSEGKEVRLLVGYRNGYVDVVERVNELGGQAVEKLPFDSLLITLPETKIDELAKSSLIETVELDEDMELLAGN